MRLHHVGRHTTGKTDHQIMPHSPIAATASEDRIYRRCGIRDIGRCKAEIVSSGRGAWGEDDEYERADIIRIYGSSRLSKPFQTLTTPGDTNLRARPQ
jgi:hypothetical protein